MPLKGRSEIGLFSFKTRRNRRQRPVAKLIAPNCNGNPWLIKFSLAMLKFQLPNNNKKNNKNKKDINGTKKPNAAGNLTLSQQQQQQQFPAIVDLRWRCRE